MEHLRCRTTDLPKYLYRVQYTNCATRWSTDGLFAVDGSTMYGNNDINALAESVERQFNWSNRRVTPWISLFSDYDHAKNWALRSYDSDGKEFTLLTVDTSRCTAVCTFKLETLRQELNLRIPHGARSHLPGCYLALHRIPDDAIVSVQTHYDICNGK